MSLFVDIGFEFSDMYVLFGISTEVNKLEKGHEWGVKGGKIKCAGVRG